MWLQLRREFLTNKLYSNIDKRDRVKSKEVAQLGPLMLGMVELLTLHAHKLISKQRQHHQELQAQQLVEVLSTKIQEARPLTCWRSLSTPPLTTRSTKENTKNN
jgi:hypothetical protein